MANIIDATSPIAITVIPQGLANLDIILTIPGGPVAPGTQVTAKAGVRNNGATDTIFAKLYANGVIFNQGTFQITAGSLYYFDYPYTVNQTTTFSCECGHMVGSTEVVDHPHTVAPFWTTEVIVLPEGVFVGTPTYNPGQQVEPGTPVTITYQVQNNGGAGMLWGGLYDYATPIPTLIGGYWEQNVAPGAPVNKSVTITVTQNLDAQLLVGHFE